MLDILCDYVHNLKKEEWWHEVGSKRFPCADLCGTHTSGFVQIVPTSFLANLQFLGNGISAP